MRLRTPDDNHLSLLNHTLKFVNESLAVWLQKSPHSAIWAEFDAVQCYKALTALRAKTDPKQSSPATDNDLDIEDATEAIATATGDNAQQWQKFVRYANYTLATAETITRVAATLNNNNPTITNLGDSSTNKFFSSLVQQSEFYHGLTSLIRLTRYSLQAPDKKKMAVLMVLVLAEIITVICQYKGIAKHKADEEAAYNDIGKGPRHLLTDLLETNEQTTTTNNDTNLDIGGNTQDNATTPNNANAIQANYITLDQLFIADPANDPKEAIAIQQPTTKAPVLSDNKQAIAKTIALPAAITAVQERRRLDGVDSANRLYNQDNDFTICLTQFAQECQQEHRDSPHSIWFQRSFNAWCHERGIEPFFDLGIRPLFDAELNRFQQAFNAFWANVQQNQDGAQRPPFIRPGNNTQQSSTGSVADFCNAFAEFYRIQPQAKAPTLHTHAPLASLFYGTRLKE